MDLNSVTVAHVCGLVVTPELTDRFQCAVGYVQCTGSSTTLPALVSIDMFSSIWCNFKKKKKKKTGQTLFAMELCG